MSLGNYFDALLGLVLLLALGWSWVRGRTGVARTPRDVTAQNAPDWVAMVAQVTGYGVTINDAERRIVWVNDSFTRMTGFTTAEASGRKASDLLFFAGTDAGTVRRVRGAFASGRGIRFEILVRSKDGREWWLDTDARPLRDAEGVLKGWVCIQADVTAEVRKREASRRHESRAQMMIQGGNIGTWEWDLTTDLVETNSEFLSSLGYDPEERIHAIEWLRDLAHPDDRERCGQVVDDVMDGRDDLYRGSHRLRAKDGSWRWVLGTAGVLERGPDGKPLRMYGIQLDITEHKVAEEQRLLVSERLAVIANNVPGMIFQMRLTREETREFLYASPGAVSVYGLDPETMVRDGSAALRRITHEDDREVVAAALRRSRETLTPVHLEHRVVRADGEIEWIEGDAVPRKAEDGSTVWNGYMANVTSGKRAQEELRLSEAKLRSLYDLSPLGIALNDMNGRFLQTNRAVEMITGYTQDEILSMQWSDWQITNGDSDDLLEIEALLKDGRFGPVEMSLRRKDGSRVPVQITGIIVHSTDGMRHVWSMIEDISVRKRTEQRISFLAYHDALTGLENRLGLRSKLEVMLVAAERTGDSLAVVLIDLDRFKYVNDTLGHDVGDELLVEIARRLKSTIRDVDVVARLGGDEFVLALRLPDPTQVDGFVQQLFRQLRGNFRLASRTVYTTCSIGISLAPKDGTDASTLLKHADLAMYSAKAQGGDSYRLFDNAMRPGTDRLSLEVELRDALERNELDLYYQPRMDTITGRPTSMEALVRWNHPTRGLMLPGLFIPIAEETGLIDAIGQWVLERACRDARAWLDAGGEPFQFSINLSPVQFAREELAERIASALAAARLPPECLELEITETVAMRSPELAARHLARLRVLGVSLAIDDFGTGHSSLSRLKLLNVDCVKIDRSLIKDCAANAHDAALCRAAIALGLALGLEVVAEGVETQEQRQFLAQERCSTIQGYLLARPMPVREAFALVRSLLKVPRLRGSFAK